jgi:hypothetical protein
LKVVRERNLKSINSNMLIQFFYISGKIQFTNKKERLRRKNFIQKLEK